MLGEAPDLGADEAVGDRVDAAPADLDDPVSLDANLEAARVGAVERTVAGKSPDGGSGRHALILVGAPAAVAAASAKRIPEVQAPSPIRIADEDVSVSVSRHAVRAGSSLDLTEARKLSLRRDAENGHRRALAAGQIEVRAPGVVIDDVHAVPGREARKLLAGRRLQDHRFALGASREEKPACR